MQAQEQGSRTPIPAMPSDNQHSATMSRLALPKNSMSMKPQVRLARSHSIDAGRFSAVPIVFCFCALVFHLLAQQQLPKPSNQIAQAWSTGEFFLPNESDSELG